MSSDARKPVFMVSDQARHKPASIISEKDEAWNFRFKKVRNCPIHDVKTKALISRAATA